MTCQHCCGANKLFDLKSARKELKRYKKKGPHSTTRKLIEALSKYNPVDKTLLDVGGGIGAIQWHFLEKGAAKTTDIDASEGYLKVAEDYSKENDWQSKTDFHFGDINDVANELSPYDFVTLDKVICCYPDYQAILQTAMNKCNNVIALTFPLGGPIAHLISFFGRIYLKLTKNPFRPYIHSAKGVDQLINENGFTSVYKSQTFPWRVWVYERSQNSRL